MVGDAGVALAMLRGAAQAARVKGSSWSEWTKKVQGQVASWMQDLETVSRDALYEGKLNPYHLMHLLNQYLGPDDLLVADTGYMAVWAVTVLQQKRAGRNTLRAAGSLGWAFPAAFGAKLAVGDKRRVVRPYRRWRNRVSSRRFRDGAPAQASRHSNRDEQFLAGL